MKKSMEILQKNKIKLKKNKNKIILWSSNPTCGYMFKGNEITISKRYLYSSVHWSIIYHNQHMETTQVFINRWMGKEYMVNVHNIILIFSHKKKGNSAICNNMDWVLH